MGESKKKYWLEYDSEKTLLQALKETEQIYMKRLEHLEAIMDDTRESECALCTWIGNHHVKVINCPANKACGACLNVFERDKLGISGYSTKFDVYTDHLFGLHVGLISIIQWLREQIEEMEREQTDGNIQSDSERKGEKESC